MAVPAEKEVQYLVRNDRRLFSQVLLRSILARNCNFSVVLRRSKEKEGDDG